MGDLGACYDLDDPEAYNDLGEIPGAYGDLVEVLGADAGLANYLVAFHASYHAAKGALAY